jgi:hypothetical protein
MISIQFIEFPLAIVGALFLVVAIIIGINEIAS